MTITTNRIQCLKCHDIIESRTRHEFKSCNCGSVFVDGGTKYLRRLGNPEDWKELSEWTDDDTEEMAL